MEIRDLVNARSAALAFVFLAIHGCSDDATLQKIGEEAAVEAHISAFLDTEDFAEQLPTKSLPDGGDVSFSVVLQRPHKPMEDTTFVFDLAGKCANPSQGNCSYTGRDGAYSCTNRGNVLTCSSAKNGTKTFTQDGRFLWELASGTHASGVWHQGSRQKSERTPLFEETIKSYDNAFSQYVQEGVDDVARTRRQNMQRLNALTGFLSALPQSTYNSPSPGFGSCPSRQQQYEMYRQGTYCGNSGQIDPACRSSITCSANDGSTGALQ